MREAKATLTGVSVTEELSVPAWELTPEGARSGIITFCPGAVARELLLALLLNL